LEGISRGRKFAAPIAVALVAVALGAGCAAPIVKADWVKTGADDQTTARQIDECRSYAAEVDKKQTGINEDRAATLGRNWALSYTTGLHVETMRQQTAALVDQAFNNCMRAKGFTPRG
jgi:hypothetical protein